MAFVYACTFCLNGGSLGPQWGSLLFYVFRGFRDRISAAMPGN